MTAPSDIPGTLRSDISPAALKQELASLTNKVEAFTRNYDKIIKLPATVHMSHDRRPSCFMIMPFNNPHLDIVYEDFLLPALQQACEVDCLRGDNMYGSSSIIDDVKRMITGADLAIADLTGQNANVFYELGMCHALEKPVLLLSQSKDDIPFDVRHLRVLLYEYSPRGCKRLEQSIKSHIDAMIIRK